MGKSSAPKTPDYKSAAEATAQGNLEATRAATQANRINQYTPYGSLTYTQKPTNDYDYEAYNKALSEYNTALSNYNGGGTSSGGIGWDGRPDSILGAGQSQQGSTSAPIAPNLESYKRVNPDAGWEQTMTLTPEAQKALDQQLALNTKYGETANIGFDKARELFENPELDTSVLPERAINVGQTAQEAILSRLNPQLAQQDESLRARLANQGITLGSDAYSREMALQSQRANDLQMQAALQGINLDQANRAAALQEQAYLQDRPLNLVNALRTGNQVQAPQFSNYAQQQVSPGANYLGAAQLEGQANLANANARNAASSGMLGGLFSLGGSLFGAAGSAGGFGNLFG